MGCYEKNNDLILLREEILKGKNRDVFKVFAIETAGGKTTTSISAMTDSIKNTLTNRKFVFISKFKAECIKIANEINLMFENKKAIALIFDESVHDSNCTRNIYEVKNYDILITTHATYCNMSNPKSDKHIALKNIIYNNFHTLIIDEEINPVKEGYYEFSKADIEIIQILLNSYNKNIGENFNNFVCKLLEELNSNNYSSKNQLHRVNEINILKITIDVYYNNIYKDIENMNEEWLKDNTNETITTLLNKLDSIYSTWMSILDNVALINVKEGKIYSYNYNFNYLMLKNNIWLDASANFYTIYNNSLFNVVKVEKTIKHDKCKVNIIKVKTTTSAKNVDKKFRDDITKYINENVSNSSKGVVLTKKVECESLESEEKYLKNNKNISLLNFENMRGVNDYRDYKQCFYVHTYRLSPAYYVFLHEYFNNIILPDKEIEVKRINNVEWGFANNKEIQELMISDMASSMYQGLKRIERNRNPKATFHIFCKEMKVVHMALKEMNGILNKDILKVIEERPIGNKEAIINFIDNIWDKKRITCKDVYNEQLGIDKKIWSAIWKDEAFLTEMKKKRVKIGYTKHSKKTMYLMKY